MADPAATLRALAGACEECDRFDRVIRGRSGCDSAQRDALMCALPHGGWPETAATLRTMADTVDRLTRERDEARVRTWKARDLLAECVAEVEARGADPSLAAAIRAWLEVSDG